MEFRSKGFRPCCVCRKTKYANCWSIGLSGPECACSLLFLDEVQCFVSRAELRCVFIENYGNGNVLQQIFKVPFVLERIEEGAVLHFLEDFDGDAAGYVNAAERQHFQREIACFRAIDVSPEIESFHADGASLVQSVLGDFRRGIGVRIGEGRMPGGRIDEFVKRAEAAAGKNQFPTDLRIAAAHEAEPS